MKRHRWRINEVTILFCLSLIAAVMTSCAHTMYAGTEGRTLKMRLMVEQPESYTVVVRSSVGEQRHRIAEDGCVTIDIPPTPRHCRTYFLGFWIAGDDFTPEIEVCENSKKKLRLTMKKVASYPQDGDGFYLVRLRKREQ